MIEYFFLAFFPFFPFFPNISFFRCFYVKRTYFVTLRYNRILFRRSEMDRLKSKVVPFLKTNVEVLFRAEAKNNTSSRFTHISPLIDGSRINIGHRLKRNVYVVRSFFSRCFRGYRGIHRRNGLPRRFRFRAVGQGFRKCR